MTDENDDQAGPSPRQRKTRPSSSGTIRIAYEIGFGDRERMRRALLRNFGLPPQAVRRTAQL